MTILDKKRTYKRRNRVFYKWIYKWYNNRLSSSSTYYGNIYKWNDR